MELKYAVVIGLVLILNASSSQARQTCPTPDTVTDLNITRFMDVWHDFTSTEPYLDLLGRCVKYHFSLSNDNETILVNSSRTVLINIVRYATGVLKPLTSPQEGKFNMTLTAKQARNTGLFPSNGLSITIPFWVLGTDYEKYAIIWSCIKVGDREKELAFTKIRKLPSNKAEEHNITKIVEDAVEKTHLKGRRFFKCNQRNCKN